MAKRSKEKREKPQANVILFLVEGDSDVIALETPLALLIDEKHPEYQVMFLQQHKLVNQNGDEMDDDPDDDFIPEAKYDIGGDVTTTPCDNPEKIVQKINSRFIQPAINNEGIYPKRIARIIQITDLDGAYIPDEGVRGYQPEREGYKKPYYNANQRVIETNYIEGIIERNRIKRRNTDYLYSLTNEGIKIKQKTIPYEIYYFSSNLDHFINNDANIKEGKRDLADRFLRTYGLETEEFCKFFFEDAGSIGKMGYSESWDMIREGSNSIGRYTNIDCLIQKLLDGDI